MNKKIICAFLGFVALLLGVGMLVCMVWGLPVFGGGPEEIPACKALHFSALICFVIGGVFSVLGRGYDTERLYLREAFACVSLCWVLSVLLGAMPYIFAKVERREGVPVTICDAIYESTSGITTTGGTIFEDLENPETLPRTILFWRSLTHFLGGLGIMCCFVVFLGKGASGKAVLKVEHLFSGNLPFAKMRQLAFSLFTIYMTLCLACVFWFRSCGMTSYDAISHAFSVVALGGFGTHNDSVGFFMRQEKVHAIPLVYGMIFFMVVSGMNYWLLYWASRGSFKKLWNDAEWRFYILSLVVVAVLTSFLGAFQGGFILRDRLPPPESLEAVVVSADPIVFGLEDETSSDVPSAEAAGIEVVDDCGKEWRESSHCRNCSVVCDDWEDVFRKSLFHTVSLMTSMGFATERYECWSGSTILLFMIIMFMGGCSGSPAGGVKVNRMLLALRLLRNEPERRFRPNVVKTTKYGYENVDTETATSALKYLGYFALLIVITTVVVCAVEPDSLWSERDRPQIEKLFDLFGGSLAMFGNTGLAFGEFGAAGNYGNLSGLTKLIFSWAMIVGRLEIWCVLALFTKKFWTNR